MRDGATVYALDVRGVSNRMSASVQGGYVERDYRYGGERTTNEELEATAQLFSASYDMLEAIKFAEQRYVELVESGDAGYWDVDTDPIVVKLREAMAKAKGRQP